MKVNTQSNIQQFTSHLKSLGWAILSTPEGDMLLNTTTGKQKKLKGIAGDYARWAVGNGLSPTFHEAWTTALSTGLPYIEDTKFNPANPMGLSGNVLNTYREFVPKNKPASLAVWNEYLSRMFPVIEEQNHILDYLAHILQKPAQRTQYVLTIIGDKGCGKSSLGDLLALLVAGQYKAFMCPSDMTKASETGITDSLVCVIDDYKKQIDNESLKSIITARTKRVEEKYKQSEMRQAYARIIVFTNYLEPYINVDESERRHYAPSYIAHKVSQQETVEWLSNEWNDYLITGGIEAIYNSLITRDISGFNASTPPASAIVDSWRIDDLALEYDDFFERHPVITAKDCASKLEITLKEAGSLLRSRGYGKPIDKILGTKTPPHFRNVYSRLPREQAKSYLQDSKF